MVSTVKLLGLNISSDLRWNCHVAEISQKVASRLYFLKQPKRANIPAKDLPIFYLTYTCLVTEYACPVFHNALPAYLSAELEQLHRRAMQIICRLFHIATHCIKPTRRRSPDAGSLSQLSFSIPSLVAQTINCMSSCHCEDVYRCR